jgi:predicted metalloprotease with PDZ domain
MHKAKLRIGILAFLLPGLMGSLANCSAQGLLERLEDRIRQRLGTPAVEAEAAPALSLGIEAEERGRNYPYQVVVVSVRRDSYSAAAGLRPGDVIVSLDGKPVGSIDDIAAVLMQKKMGQTMALSLTRQGENQELTLNFNRAGDEPAVREAIQRPKPGSGRLGVTVENPTTAPPGAGVPVERGAVVVAVAPGSPASIAGIIPGNVIVSINGVLIEEAAKLIEIISATTPGQTIDLSYYQGESLVRARVTLAGNVPPEAMTPEAVTPAIGGAGENLLPPAANMPVAELPQGDATVDALRLEIDSLKQQLEALEKRLSALERRPAEAIPESPAVDPPIDRVP